MNKPLISVGQRVDLGDKIAVVVSITRKGVTLKVESDGHTFTVALQQIEKYLTCPST